MLLLTSTTDKLSLITDEASAVKVVATFTDRNQTTGNVGLSDRQVTSIVTATTTDIVAVPAATTTRNINKLNIRNAHATAAATVTLQYNANGTLYQIYRTVLFPGDTLEYMDGLGFYTTQVNVRYDRVFVLKSEVDSNSGSTPSPLFTMELETGKKYCYFACLFADSALTTTGIRYGFCTGNMYTTHQSAGISSVLHSPNACTLSAGATTAALQSGSAIVNQATGPAAAKYPPSYFGGYIEGVTGTQCVFGLMSEVGTSLVACVRGWIHVWEVTG